MSKSRRLSRPSILVLAVALAGLAACQKSANQAATNPADAPPPLAALALTNDATVPPPAPATDALPAAAPIQTASLAGPPDASYAYVDRAYEVNHGFGDAPPDYGFDYDGGQPWAWRSDDGYERVDEPVNGGDRDYYYEPNSDDPYLVRDDDYSYGYRGGILVVVYDREGRALPADQYSRYTDRASRLYFRARQLRAAEQRQPHRGVGRTPWEQRRGAMMADRQAWTSQQQSNPDWRTYHDQSAPQYAAFDAMRARRESEAVRADQTLQDSQAEARDRQAAQRAQAAVQVQAQAQGRSPGGFHPPAPPPVAAPPAQMAQGRGAPNASTPPLAVTPAVQARVQAEQQQQTQAQARLQAQQQQAISRASAAGQAQSRLQAQQQAAAADRAAAASQAQARAQAATQRQAEAEAAAAKSRSDALARQQGAQQARIQAQQQAAAQAQARSQALAQQQQQAAARRQAQQAAAAQQRAQALSQQQAQMKARQAAQQQTAAQAQARAQAAAQQRAQAQATAQQQRQAAVQARKVAAGSPPPAKAAAGAAHTKHKPATPDQPAPKP